MIRRIVLRVVALKAPAAAWVLVAGCLVASLAGAQNATGSEAVPSSKQNCEDLRGRWQTNTGATVHFASIDSQTGRIDGSYQPASLRERHFPLSGFVNAATEGEERPEGHYAVVLSFSVSFLEYGGITNWTGICRQGDGGVRLETQDLVVRPVSEAPWAHVIASHDVLTPMAVVDSPAPSEGPEGAGGPDS